MSDEADCLKIVRERRKRLEEIIRLKEEVNHDDSQRGIVIANGKARKTIIPDSRVRGAVVQKRGAGLPCTANCAKVERACTGNGQPNDGIRDIGHEPARGA